jgi:RND family efflux transporter MFP subunit
MGYKIVSLSVFLTLCGIVAMVGYQRAKENKADQVVPVIKPEVVRCAPLEMRPFTVTESFHGRIFANAELNMSFQIQGRLSQLGATPERRLRENDMVQKGDLIAMLEPARFKAAVDQASAQKNEAAAEMEAATGAMTQATAVTDDAQREYDRQLDLLKKDAAKQRDIDRAETALKVARAQFDVAKARYARAVATYDSANAALTVAKVNHEDAMLRSPIDGKIAALPVEVGMMMRPGEMVVRVIDMRKVKLVIGVVERKRPQVSEGQTVQVEVLALTAAAQASRDVDAKVAPRPGIVTMVPPAADPATGLFNVEIELDNKDGLLKPGMIAKASISLREDQQVIAVPADAVRRKGNKLTAFFVAEGLPVGLDLGAIGKASMTVPTMVVREFVIEKAILVDDHYLVSGLPRGVTHLVVEGQTRIADGKPVVVVSHAPAVALTDGDQPVGDVPSNRGRVDP